ncbi:major facilitator superfamily transporter [Fusarium albosuccineum]|uniref:Major facilitator superfamily transporter n=1 Tax=Fusarium albosuccineum TaxID=1237068 RepID=A0A8H4LPU0_9HYPO|nr:major facilitator superfamily transporter [Fusarium albosuccineum]
MSTTTTAIELLEPSTGTSNRGPYMSGNRDQIDLSTDEILKASILADSTVPDGGYGWVIVGSGAVMLWWALGTTYAWGVMQRALVEDGLSTPATLSFIGSLDAALMSALAIVNSRLMRAIGMRRTAVLGVTVMGGSEILSSFAVKNLGAMFFTSGVLMGTGVSLCSVVTFAVIAQWFNARRGLANGLMFAGAGFGGATLSFAVDALIQRLNISWAYRILGLLTLVTGLPAAWAIRERTPTYTPGFIEWRLFRSFTFDLVFLASAVGTFPLFVPPFFLPLYTKSLGFSSTTGAGLVAGFNLASAVGRIACGLACDKLGSLNTLFISLILAAVSMLAIWPASTTLAPMIAFVLINGVSNGGFFSTMPTVVGHVFVSARVAIAMSMILTGWAGGYLMGAPIAGYLLEAYGGADAGLQAYRPAMFYAGSLALGSAGMVAAVRLRKNRSPWARL